MRMDLEMVEPRGERTQLLQRGATDINTPPASSQTTDISLWCLSTFLSLCVIDPIIILINLIRYGYLMIAPMVVTFFLGTYIGFKSLQISLQPSGERAQRFWDIPPEDMSTTRFAQALNLCLFVIISLIFYLTDFFKIVSESTNETLEGQIIFGTNITIACAAIISAFVTKLAVRTPMPPILDPPFVPLTALVTFQDTINCIEVRNGRPPVYDKSVEHRGLFCCYYDRIPTTDIVTNAIPDNRSHVLPV